MKESTRVNDRWVLTPAQCSAANAKATATTTCAAELSSLVEPEAALVAHLDPVVEEPDHPVADDGEDDEGSRARKRHVRADVADEVSEDSRRHTMAMPPMVGVPALTWCMCGAVVADVLADLACGSTTG